MQHLLHFLPAAFLFALQGTPYVNAQSWEWVESFAVEGDQSIDVLMAGPQAQLFFGGTYEDKMELDGQSLPVYGGKDIFLAWRNREGAIEWSAAAGGPFDDDLAVVRRTVDGGILAAGTYWQEARFGDTQIMTTVNLKGIFLAKYDEATGALQWVKSFEGTQLKEVQGMTIDGSGNIFLTGYFEDRLFLDDRVLTAKGKSDLFLAKLSPSGEVVWAVADGYSGNTRATAIALTPEEEPLLGGYFNDTTVIAGDTITANTFDRDVFLARYDGQGEALWVRKAGGVHDDELTGLIVADDGTTFATGSLVGVMRLSETIQIESSTGQSDFFLLKYSAGGTPLNARAMGGSKIQQATQIVLHNQEVVLSGIYQGVMEIDGTILSGGEGFGSFVAAYDPELNLQWAKNLPSDDNALVNQLEVLAPGTLVIGGTYSGALALDAVSLPDALGFDSFISTLSPTTTAIPAVESMPPLEVFPNPAADVLHIRPQNRPFQIALFDLRGRLVLHRQNEDELDVAHLPPGLYLLHYRDEQRQLFRKVSIIGQ